MYFVRLRLLLIEKCYQHYADVKTPLNSKPVGTTVFLVKKTGVYWLRCRDRSYCVHMNASWVC